MDPELLAVRIDRVTKRYDAHVAVESLSLDVPAGIVFGLLGPNGAGKSTTIRMLNGIIAPDHGSIELLGALPPGPRASREIGYLPEERGLYPMMTVTEVLVFFGELRGLRASEAHRRALRWLERLELGAWRDRRVRDLSKGMQQKVQFVTAVIHEPELLILDEPWSGLDPINAEVLQEIVQDQKRAGRSIVFSTHQMDHAERICDRVCIVSRGRKVAEGTVAELKREGAAERTVAVVFVDRDHRQRADGLLVNSALVTAHRGEELRAEIDLADGASPGDLMRALADARVELRRFELLEPTLHQVFVQRVRAAEMAHA